MLLDTVQHYYTEFKDQGIKTENYRGKKMHKGKTKVKRMIIPYPKELLQVS